MQPTVVITGGSRGLGFALAQQWAARGANVAICGRDEAALARASDKLAALGSNILTTTCDVGNVEDVEYFLNKVADRFGTIDILVNNAGVITVGPIDEQRLVSYEEAIRTMYLGMVHTSLAVLPKMVEQNAGHIVNITSIGGKVSAPHLLPYSGAKAAAVAFSNGLQAETTAPGVHVLTVIPGFMRTGSQEHVDYLGRAASEYKWFTVAGNMPIASISVDRAAKKIIAATLTNKRQLILTPLAQTVARLADVSPGLNGLVLRTVNRLLPQSPQRPLTGAQEGEELPRVHPKVIAHIERSAAESHNQIESSTSHQTGDPS